MPEGCRVLVVESNYFISQDIAAMLREARVEVVGPFANIRDALEALKTTGIDAALIDLRLAKESGFPLAASLSQRAIPFAFCRDYDPEAIPERFHEAPLIEKPFNPGAVISAVFRLCAASPAKRA